LCPHMWKWREDVDVAIMLAKKIMASAPLL
jgi:hypothetical protein